LEETRLIAERKQLAYTSAILAALYGFNGWRERGDSYGLQNVFYFLSFNFSLVSAANFYRLWNESPTVETSWLNHKVEIAFFPNPSVTVVF